MLRQCSSRSIGRRMIPRNSSYQRLNVLHSNHHQKIHLRAISTKNGNNDFIPADRYTLDDLNENVLKAKYAVRGKIPMLAEELQKKLHDDPGSFPFDSIIYSNIGNPQQLDQKPLTFFRQVLSLLQHPDLLDAPESELVRLFKPDAIRRARSMLDDVGTSIGAYSHSQGVYGFREKVAEFITARDGVEAANPENIFLTAGASSAVSYILSLFTKGPKTGVLIPIPQYPLYTATIALNNAQVLPYYLDELSGWSTNPKDVEGVVLDAVKRGIKPTCMVVINPGNPTGAILPVEALEEILRIAAKYGIVLIADEVYQDNIFGDSEFFSARKVLKNLQSRHSGLYDNVQLVSLHSTSKGLLGECGQRGGYMELLGFNNEIIQALFKLCCISLCPPVSGQALVSLMSSPPKEGDESFEKHQFERKQIQNQLEKRSNLLWKTFNSLEGIECQKPKGAMYLFPRLYLSKKAVAAATQQNLKPDEFYCKALLENTGICTVPGSGFGQVEGTYHLRTTFLPPGIEWIKRWETFHKQFHAKYHD